MKFSITQLNSGRRFFVQLGLVGLMTTTASSAAEDWKSFSGDGCLNRVERVDPDNPQHLFSRFDGYARNSAPGRLVCPLVRDQIDAESDKRIQVKGLVNYNGGSGGTCVLSARNTDGNQIDFGVIAVQANNIQKTNVGTSIDVTDPHSSAYFSCNFQLQQGLFDVLYREIDLDGRGNFRTPPRLRPPRRPNVRRAASRRSRRSGGAR